MTRGDILSAAERIEERFGGTFRRLTKDVLQPMPAVSTGSLLLNEALNESRGYPEGCIVEVFGPQHSGKTLMGYLAIAECQKKFPDRPCLLIDAEHQFMYQAKWAQTLGVDVEKLMYTTVTSAEEAFEKMEFCIYGDVEMDKEGQVKRIVRPGNFGIIMIDSVSQLVPLEEIHKAMDRSTRMAALASVMSRGLRKVVSAQSLANSKTILYFINQIRANPNVMFGCMHPFTKIHTNNGTHFSDKFIKNKISEDMTSYDEKTNSFISFKPLNHFNNGLGQKEDFIKIYFETPAKNKFQYIICTKNHEIYTKNGWKEAQNLNKDDELLSYCENPLSPEQEQIFLGTIIGDGLLYKCSNLRSKVKLQNSEQKQYLQWKMDNLKILNFKAYGKSFSSEKQFFLSNYFDSFYDNEFCKKLTSKRKHRIPTLEIIKKLDLLGLAIFYLDDGHLHHNDRTNPNMSISIKRLLHLDEENMQIIFEGFVSKFKEFDINISYNLKKAFIKIDKENSNKFSNLIKNFVIEEMQYKLMVEHRGQYNFNTLRALEKPTKEKFYVKFIVSCELKEHDTRPKLMKYDIETPCHSYMVGSEKKFPGIVVHNSPETRSGGKALAFYDTIAFRVSKVHKSDERDEKNKIISHRVKIKFEKNKTGQMPADAIEFKICHNGMGVDNNDELFTVGEMNGLITKVKRGRYNFVKAGTEEILDPSIENFEREEFGSVINNNPKMKDMIMNFIKNGSFYVKDENVKEDTSSLIIDEEDIDEMKKSAKIKDNSQEPQLIKDDSQEPLIGTNDNSEGPVTASEEPGESIGEPETPSTDGLIRRRGRRRKDEMNPFQESPPAAE